MQLDYFDGTPYLMTEVGPSLYHLLLLPFTLSPYQMVDLARWQARTNKLRQCLVLLPDACLYYEPDGAETASTRIPSGGVQLSGYLQPCCELPYGDELRGRMMRLEMWLAARGWDRD